MVKPSISVIIPAFGRPGLLKRAVRSAANQSLKPLEIVVVDDGSRPALTLSCAFDIPLRLIRHDGNRGAAAARNTGVAAARGDWIAFLDSDDFWRSTKLEEQKRLLEATAEPLTVCVTGWAEVRQRYIRGAFIPRTARELGDLSQGCWFCPGSTAMFARSTWDAVGDFDNTLERLEDYDWFLRLGALGGGIVVAEEPITAITWHRDVDPGKVERASKALERRYVPASVVDLLAKRDQRNIGAYLALVRAASQYYAGHRITAGLMLARSFVLRPRWGLQLSELIARRELDKEAEEEIRRMSTWRPKRLS